MTTLAWHGLAALLAERMLNGVAEGIVLALCAWLLLRVIRRSSSSTRFAVWFFTLLALAVAPWLHGIAAGPAVARATSSGPEIVVPTVWGTMLFLVWLTIAAAGLARMVFGLWQLRKLRAHSSAMDLASLDPEVRRAWEEFQPSRAVKLAVSDELRVPTAIGFFRPLIVLPAWAMKELCGEELKSVLIHELAHLRRHDDWTNLAQKIVRAIFFFHPAVWWVERQLSLEREMACDDVVVSQAANPRSYAQCLVTMAEKSFLRRELALAQGVVSRIHHTSRRVAQILDGNRPRATAVWKPALGLVAVAAVVSTVSWWRNPELVAFQDPMLRVAAAGPVPQVVAASANQVAKVRRTGRHNISASAHVQPDVTATAVQAKLTARQANQGTSPLDHAREVTATAGAEVLVVMQTEQFGIAGTTRWTVYVWRVEVLDPSRITVGPGVRAKSI